MPAGRPTSYNKKIGDKICKELQKGLSLRKICEKKDMPHRETVFNWMGKFPEFFDQYELARKIQLENYIDDILDVCDEAISKPLINTAAYRLKIDSIKWIACKLKPKKYGDRIELDHNTNKPINVIIQPVKNDDKDNPDS